MKTENKVRAHITSPKSEDQIEECDLVVAFGISGHEDSIELQTFCVGSTIGGSATMLALARGIINAIDIIAKDHFDAIILQKFFYSAIRDILQHPNDEDILASSEGEVK